MNKLLSECANICFENATNSVFAAEFTYPEIY